MKFLVSFILLLFLVSCSDEITDNYENANNNFNIYLVIQNDEFMYRDNVDFDSLQLEEIPWVKNSDIEFYDWSAHAFYLNKEVIKSSHSTRNFVVMSGEKRLFMGVFWPMYMSSIPMMPAIMPEDDWWSPKDVIRFNSFGWPQSDKLNENEKFKSELIKADLLRKGISVEIVNLKRKSSSVLEYSFKVTNLESEKIYIPDPNKMGAAHFHYYTNGISLRQNDEYFWPNDFETKESDKINSGWYYKLKPGESIIRTVQMDGYNNLPTGKVKASFRFPGAQYLSKGEWKKSDGRIWIGNFLAEREITIN